MSNKSITDTQRKDVYTEGKRAFDEHTRRDYNPYTTSNLMLTVTWWHGWDTAEEESQGESLPIEV